MLHSGHYPLARESNQEYKIVHFPPNVRILKKAKFSLLDELNKLKKDEGKRKKETHY